MLSLFMKIYVSIETQRFARLVGNVDGDRTEFERQCKDQYVMLIKLQGGGSTGIDDDDGIDLMKLERAAEGGNYKRRLALRAGTSQGMQGTSLKGIDDNDGIDLMKLEQAAEGAAGTSQGMQGTSLKGIVKCLKEFDEDGDGNISGEEFQKMMIIAREKANLFTGTEHDPNTLNLEQLQALELFDKWPGRHKGPQDVGESEGLGGANTVLLEREKKKKVSGVSELDDAEQPEEIHARAERQLLVDAGDIKDPTLREIHEFEQELQKRQDAGPISKKYKARIREVKKMYVENPGQVNACLKRIKVEALPADELRRSVLELAHRLVVDEVIAYPAQVWSNHVGSEEEEDDDKDPSPEQIIVSRFGFLFIAYRVDCWWFEGVEMARKLLMTSVLVFIKPGTPGQMSVGAMITFVFLLLGLFLLPFCSSTLNNLNTGTLIAQFCTLFVGIMIALLDAMPAGTGQGGGDDSLDRAIMSFMVVAVNGVALSWPFIHKVFSGKYAEYYEMAKDVYLWFCSKYARWCGSKEQRAQIAAADAKIKEKKQKEKQKAKKAEAASKAARVNGGAQTEAAVHSQLVFRDKRQQTSAAGGDDKLGFECERQIPEITAPAELAENTECGQAVAVSRPSTMVFDDNLNLRPVSTVRRHETSFPASAGVPLVLPLDTHEEINVAV
jgi:hypothetical protein